MYIIHQEREADLVQRAAKNVKSWLIENTELAQSHVTTALDASSQPSRGRTQTNATDGEHHFKFFPLWRHLPNGGNCAGCHKKKMSQYCSVCFLCEVCAKHQGSCGSRGSSAHQRGDGSEDCSFPTLMHDTDCVLLLQSRGVLLEPRCLAQLYTAVAYKIPICCAFFPWDENHKDLAYDFEGARVTLQELTKHLPPDDTEELKRLLGASLSRLLGKDVIPSLAESLLGVMPSIISKPLSLELAATGKLKQSGACKRYESSVSLLCYHQNYALNQMCLLCRDE